MATSQGPQRLVWVRRALAVEPGEHLLEIGCGRGAAVSLICEKLTDGRITAIDRSASAIAAAKRANAAHVRSGTAVFQCTELAAAELDDHRFDKIFAVNVNLFWVRRPRVSWRSSTGSYCRAVPFICSTATGGRAPDGPARSSTS